MRKSHKRFVSFLLAAVMLINIIPFDQLPGLSIRLPDFSSFFSPFKVSADEFVPTKEAGAFAAGTISFSSASDFVDYCYHYANNSTVPGDNRRFAEIHQTDSLSLIFESDSDSERGIIPDGFMGLGNNEYPFKGEVHLLPVGAGTFALKTNGAPLFSYVYDSVKILSTVPDATTNTYLETTVQFVRLANVASNASTPLFAQHVLHNDLNAPSANWNVELMSTSDKTYSGVIGEIEEGAVVNLTFTNGSTANVVSNATVGAVCGTMEAGSTLNLTYYNSTSNGTSYVPANVISTAGNAGGLVGTMNGSSKLTINSSLPAITSSIISDSYYAGGLVGELTSQATITNNQTDHAKITVNSSEIKGGIAAGGLFGYYNNNTSTDNNSEFDISNYNITATVYAQYCGGVFGVLENNQSNQTPNHLTVNNTNAGTINVKSGNYTTYETNGYFGGIAGRYTTDALANSLILSGLSLTAESQASFNAFGGAVGYVYSAAYINADGVTVNAKGTNKRTTVSANCQNYAYFGGLVGATNGATSSTNGVFIDLGDFTLALDSQDSSGFCGGGVVGQFYNGVLRLSGTTNMANAKPAGDYVNISNNINNDNNTALRYASYGQLVGTNDNVLVYALGTGSDASPTAFTSGWRYLRSNGAVSDDLGTWGEVVRLFDVNDVNNVNKNAEDAEILAFDITAHTVTLAAAATSMESATDFAKTALNIQLNNKAGGYDCLLFTGDNAYTRTTLLGSSSTLSITNNISLVGTGINGFMRDGSGINVNNNNAVSSKITASDVGGVGEFTGTFDGNGHTITLAIGEIYGLNYTGNAVAATSEGVGQIYRHQYNGLFAVIGNGTTTAGTVQDLEIDGTVNVRNAGPDGMFIGGIAARSHGSTTLDGITAGQTVNYYEGADSPATENLGKNIGGFIGYVDINDTDNGTITVTGVSNASPKFYLSGNHKTWLAYGGAIGKVASTEFEINIAQNDGDKLTVGMTADITSITNVGENTDSGGLIGYILSKGNYTTRKVNIDNLEFNNCVIGNAASSNGGGFLGYAWLNTTTTIDGLTVTSGTINNTSVNGTKIAANVGVMCYEATGVWKVNSLTVNGFTMSNGAGASLGMIVNKAYNKPDNNTTNGLYLDVLNEGYTLTGSGITLPSSLGVFDEIAAYSAPSGSVLSGGAGVISIDMNSTRDGTKTKITETGTYQNKLTNTSSSSLDNSKYANQYSRYYYNINNMNRTDSEQNIMLWSVNQYAAGNIKNEFISTNSPFNFASETTVQLSQYSYYPVYNVSNLALSNVNVEFSYSGIYDLEGGTFNTDGYLRDPGDQNQHYLMQSGLFINSSEDSTLTLNTVKFSGDFLENNTYRGALISGTAKGSISVDGLVLDGITPKNNNSGAISNYTTGYLLVNKVNRADTSKANIRITLNNISNTNKYTDNNTTAQVSKSLFGDVYGPAIGINISGVKLDARDTNNNVTGQAKTDLDTAYNTVNSIFSTATLFNSLKTSQAATMIYNYERDEDWGTGNRNVTYGKEVKDSVEYAGKENKYYNGNVFTDPTTNSASSEYNFSNGWLRYVATAYTAGQTQDAQGCFNRELKVNVPATAYAEGCGTYNDPYIIDSGDKLVAIAALISSESNTNDLPALRLPKNLYDGVAANTTGDRWCDNKANHAVYSYDSNNNKYTSSESGVTTEWTVENVRLYLANAYYSIQSTGDITLDGTYLGLGGTDTSGKFAFRGVIVGNSNTIVNNSQSPLVKVSNGCVIKDLTVKQNDNVSVSGPSGTGSSDAYFGYNSQCNYYGGMIGEIMGGDNIIDNSYVEFASGKKVTLTGNNGMLCPVGSYVGVVVFGGLIFKNMNATTVNTNASSENFVVNYSNNNTNLTLQTSKGAIYVNPLVGRVINGYAVNETDGFSVTENGHYHDDDYTERTGALHSLKNNTKHYTIADIDKNVSENDKLNVASVPTSTSTDGVINIPNSQAFFILSLITQSTAGTAASIIGDYTVEVSNYTTNGNVINVEKSVTVYHNGNAPYLNSLSYGTYDGSVYGISHNADYTNVGNAASNADEDYLKASDDTAAPTAVPYIIRKYTVNTANNSEAKEDVVSQSNKTEYEYQEVTSLEELDGNGFYISNQRGNGSINYMYTEVSNNNTVNGGSSFNSAGIWYFEQKENSVNEFYIYKKLENNTTKYLAMDNSGNMSLVDDKNDSTVFTVELTESETFSISKPIGGRFGILNTLSGGANFGGWVTDNGNNKKDAGSKLKFKYTVPMTIYTEQTTIDKYISGGDYYPARCVTSTLGYYDINLTAGVNYVLPDSFRGIGSVGNQNNNYAVRLDVLDGKGCTIDEDIYLNRYGNTSDLDNYFDLYHCDTDQDYHDSRTAYTASASDNDKGKAHGIGLFDSVLMRDENSKFSEFTLSGSVNTENYGLSTIPSGTEIKGVTHNKIHWLCTGGVCGWSTYDHWCNFENIDLVNLTVRGATQSAGLIAMAGLENDTVRQVKVIGCGAEEISIEITSVYNDNNRNVIGTLVGKVSEGKVVIDGGSSGKTVTIKSMKTGLNSNRVVAGGLVAYAGNGCEATNMKVCPAASLNGQEVTIGNTDIAMAGGIVGLMQPAVGGSSTCRAVFRNCEVENINISANYAGGFYGGAFNNEYCPFSITIDNCKMTGKTTKNRIQGKEYAGGFVAHGRIVKEENGLPNIVIQNCLIENYVISSSDNMYVGGFIGYANAHDSNSSVVCYVHDSSVENCTLGGTTTNYAGGIIGRIEQNNNNKILGYNVKLKDITAGNTNRTGAWVGYASSDTDNKKTSIQLTGMAIYGQGFTKNIGNDATIGTASFVFADYAGKCEGTVSNGNTVYPTAVSGFNDNANVEMRKYPYVNINPQSSMGTGEIISGDGAVLYGETVTGFTGTGKNTMAAKIYSELNNSSIARRYTTFYDNDIINGQNIGYYMNRSVDEDSDRISTYQTERGSLPSGVSDFAVVVISNTNNTETTNLINRYIQLVTNTSTDYTQINNYYSIVIKTCKYDDGKFVITNDTPGLTFLEGTFALNGANADSGRTDTFTLIDVQFKDPLNTSKVAYHLYVPVYTIKQMTFDFYAAALTDTNSALSVYEDAMENAVKFHIDSLETWITQYIRFTYSAEDLNTLLAAGNVKWNHYKYVTFNTLGDSNSLPGDTYMVLVDPNCGSDKAYYASARDFEPISTGNGGWKVELTKFKRENDTYFFVSSFNDMIAKDIIATQVSANGMYTDSEASNTNYDVYRIDTNGTKQYYKYVPDGTGNYDLSVTYDYVLKEDYYISMYVPKADGYSNELYFYTINAPELLTGTRSAARSLNSYYNVLVADLYSQTTSYTVGPPQEQITEIYNTITVNASTTISITNSNALSYLANTPLYHAFDISLNRYENGSVINQIAGLEHKDITAKYNIGSNSAEDCNVVPAENYILVNTTNIMSNLIDASRNNTSLTISADISMVFSDIVAEFPEKSTYDTGTIGVNVAATSNLAYDSDRLAYTSMSAPLPQDTKYYHRESVSAVILSYNVVSELDSDDTYGNESKNYSRLGVNGQTSIGRYDGKTAMLINSEAVLNASAIEDAVHNETQKIRFTLSLYKKTDTEVNGAITEAKYVQVNDISDYLDEISLEIDGTTLTKNNELSTNKTYIYETPIASPSATKIYSADIKYYVFTGEDFTEYANYQVVLQAQLLNNDETIGNIASDYLVYTNAKVYPTVIAKDPNS